MNECLKQESTRLQLQKSAAFKPRGRMPFLPTPSALCYHNQHPPKRLPATPAKGLCAYQETGTVLEQRKKRFIGPGIQMAVLGGSRLLSLCPGEGCTSWRSQAHCHDREAYEACDFLHVFDAWQAAARLGGRRETPQHSAQVHYGRLNLLVTATVPCMLVMTVEASAAPAKNLFTGQCQLEPAPSLQKA